MTDPQTSMALSVIVPLGRVDAEFDEQLVALANQDITVDWELILSLNTPDPIQKDKLDVAVDRFIRLAGPTAPKVRVVDSAAVQSASHARNVGAAAAASPLLAFCDGDDIADKSWLSSIVAALDQADAVGGFLEEELLAIRGQENWRPAATPGANPTFLDHPFLVSANMGVRASVFDRVGGFDVSLTRGEDIAFSWALLRSGVQLCYEPGAIMHYRHRKGLRPMLHQHYLYGRGMSEILHRFGLPVESQDDTPSGSGRDAASVSRMLKPNGQKTENRSVVHVLRRGSIAIGRLVGMALEVTPGNGTSKGNGPTQNGRADKKAENSASSHPTESNS